VIFNGSGGRKPLARAGVELIFDNSLGRAAGQWSQYAEISVKRVLQRDGESSYHINNVHVRRRDITDMFLGTGLGPRAYAIIEQGMISRVIEAKPEELRIFLEEAAGVSKYKERRRETENRLSDTRENLARVNDIRIELGAQIDKLRVQAEVAGRYKGYQSELQAKQGLLWYLRRRDAEAERQRHAQEIAKSANELESETARLRELEAKIEAARASHYQAGDALNASQAALYAANTEVARNESELRHAEETRQRLETQLGERRAQLGSWRGQRSQLTQALHMWASRAAGAQQRVVQARSRLEAENARLPEAERSFRAAQERLNEARTRVMQADGRLQVTQSDREHLGRNLESLAQRRQRLEAELQALVEPQHELKSSLETRIGDLDAAIAAAQSKLELVQADCAGLETRQAAAAEQLAAASREFTAAEAQIATLRQIQAAAEDNAPLREWLDKHGLSALPRLWQKLRIDPGWEVAVEAVLRERLHALELADAERLAPVLADRPPVKASLFLPGAASGSAPSHGAVPLAGRVHAIDEAVAGAIEDWFAGVFAVDGVPSADTRAALPVGAVLVNRDGHRFTRHTVSLHAPDPEDAGLLARQAEIEALESGFAALSAAVSDAAAQKERIESALAERQASLEAVREEIAAHQADLHGAQIELLKVTQAHERYRERTGQIRAELAEIATHADRDRERLTQCEEQAAALEQEIRSARARLEAVKAEHLSIETALADQRRAVQQAEREAQEALFGERECASKISEIDHSVRVIDQQIGRAEEEIARLGAELAEDPIPEIRRTLDAAVEARIACEKTLAGTRDVAEQASAQLRELEEGRVQADARIAPLRDRIGELKLKEQAAQINAEQFAAQLREANADEAGLATQAERAPRPSALQGEIARLTQAMNDLGAVNLAALEELKTGEERKGFLDAQAGDLDEAVRTLEDAIRRIDRETRELLAETFASVNRHFGTLFPALFGGGEAKLTITGEEILDAGVQVMAQPPGKRNSTIHLLSGGEKALTAIALVFSLFQLNPAPFCLLDEVDAPLDDSNTVRFCELVKKMSAQTQFLFISHNKIAMEMAEQLVGVTMPESGVSRVVAVDIDEALRMREELAA
jgi:chromosome segregation protein